jgi:precorrin-6A/cobalt-precorrin-6A reductase
MAMRVLVLGGSAEASELAACLATEPAFNPTLSLAGRTRHPITPPIPYRIGGFGGSEGLAAYLMKEKVDFLVDATHPFAEQISANAVIAARQTGTPLIVFTRSPWTPQEGDRWTECADFSAAAKALGTTPLRVLLTIGRLQLGAFESAPQHDYVIRTIDPPELLPNLPRKSFLFARGPFTLADEIRLMVEEKIDVLVSKNSGGDAARAKLDAARALNLKVILVRRPRTPQAAIFYTLEETMICLRKSLHRDNP